MKAIRIALALAPLLAMIFATPAQAQLEEATTVSSRLMVRSGMAAQLQSFTNQIDAEITRNAANLDPRTLGVLGDAARQAFRADLLLDDMTGRIVKKLTVSDMRAALSWLETEPGTRITLAEERASETINEERLRRYLERLAADPLPPSRAELISRLVTVTNAVQAAVATQEAIAFGVAIGMDSLQPKERRLGDALLRGRLREVMPPEALRAAFAQQLPVIFAYMYRDVSDSDLSGYLGFLKSAAGKRYQDAMTGALIEGLGRASVKVGELAGQQVRQSSM